MSNLTFGGPNGNYAYYETIAGGAGGGPMGDGAHAVQTHMTNTRNTPIEALESELPVVVLATDVRRGSGGAGLHPGGDGVRKRLRFLESTRVGFIAERQRRGPGGLAGGTSGAAGSASWRPSGARRDRPLPGAVPGKASFDMEPGAELEVLTPGGGGYGRPTRSSRASR